MITRRSKSYLVALRFVVLVLLFSACAGTRKTDQLPRAFYDKVYDLQERTFAFLATIKKYDNGFEWYIRQRQEYLGINNDLKLLRLDVEQKFNDEAVAQQLAKIEETLFAVKKLYMIEDTAFAANRKYLPQIVSILNQQYGKLLAAGGERYSRAADHLLGIR